MSRHDTPEAYMRAIGGRVEKFGQHLNSIGLHKAGNRSATVSRSASSTSNGSVLPGPLEDQELTEHSLGLAFTNEHADMLRYCHHAEHWFIWTGNHWSREETRLVFSLVRKLVQTMLRRLTASAGVRVKFSRAAVAAAIERFAQADRAFAVTSETWNRNRWLLGTPGGTVDLRTGKLRAADRADLITVLTAVAPAPLNSPHPIWTAFLAQVTGNDERLQAFLQRFIGYCLTGTIQEEVLVFLYGEGGTGKGTLIGIIVAILKDYAVTVPIEVFTAGSRINLEYYRARMAGARLVTASETEAGVTWAESLIKEMTGNETPLSARHPYGKPFEYMPQFKIGLVGNHAPRLKGRTRAMERRLRIIPFKHKPPQVDVDLKAKLKAEYPAILRWMIEGCVMWQRDSLGTCPAVEAETAAYFDQQDHFGKWLAERCVVGTSLNPVSERPSKLLVNYLAWAKENGEEPITPMEFRELIERTPGLKYVHNKGLQWVRGIAVKPAMDPRDHNSRCDQ